MAEYAVARGPASRARPSPELFAALDDRYGFRHADDAVDIGGSSNLNLRVSGGDRPYVVRVYRPWVTAARLASIQTARRVLGAGDVPSAQPVPTRDGHPWIEVDGRLVEVEPFVEHDARMNSWTRLEAGLPLLGRTHALLRTVDLGEGGRVARAANHIEPRDVPREVLRGTTHLRSWDPTPGEQRLAASAEELARRVADAESGLANLPRQLVHGDFWDDNVLFREGRVVQVGDFDFMGERRRIDDLALALYYTNSTFAADRASDRRADQLRVLVDAYDGGLDRPLSRAERAALPLALARTPLCFIAMLPAVDSERGARELAASVADDLAWALAVVYDLGRWQRAFS